MTPNKTKLVGFTFLGLSGALVLNLLVLQPATSTRLNGRAGERAQQKSAQALALAIEEPRVSDAPGAPKSRVNSDSRAASDLRTAAIDKKTPAPKAGTTVEQQSPGSEGPETIRAVQRELQARGYEAGTVDGVPGLITRAAILAYEYDHGLPMTGEASERLLKQILLGELQPSATPGAPTGSAEHSPQAEQVIRTVQQSLANAGYAVGKPDGRMGEETVRAIREFETDQGLPETGRVSGQLVARLARLAGQGRLTAR